MGINQTHPLEDKTLVITGGTSGVGKEVVIEALQQGAKVAFCWHSAFDKYEALASTLPSGFKDRWIGIKADVSKEKEVDAFFEQTLKTFGKIDIVISNAALSRDSLLVSLPEETWDEIIGTNLNGAFLICQRAIRVFLAQQSPGCLLISGSLAQTGTPSNACYSASKGGLIGLVKWIAKEFENQQITANLITYGLIDTDLTRDYPAFAKEILIRSSPLKRSAKPQEVAQLLLFLASHETSLNGQIIYATNGLADFPLFFAEAS